VSVRKRGRGWSAETFYSICSKHRNYDPLCHSCQCGEWMHDGVHSIEHVVFKVAPWLWRWFANRGREK
jgi:hypothetical protein